MPVPGDSSNYLRGTKNTAFSSQNQGGTLLGNDKVSSPASPVANLFPLKDNAVPSIPTLPKVKADGLNGNQRATAGVEQTLSCMSVLTALPTASQGRR